MIQAAILGCGTIGSGVYEVIERNQEQIQKRCRIAVIGSPARYQQIKSVRENGLWKSEIQRKLPVRNTYL